MIRGALTVVALLTPAFAGCDAVFGTGTPIDAPPIDAAPLLPKAWDQVTSGTWHTCGIRVDRTLWCWGRNDEGQLAQLQAITETDVPLQVGVRTDWRSVVTSSDHTCALTLDDELFCWGRNRTVQVGPNPALDVFEPRMIMGKWKAVATGLEHTCALRFDDGRAECWGGNGAGQLGVASLNTDSPVAVQVDGTAVFRSIEAGFTTTCALDGTGVAWCWGGNGRGQAGNGGATPQRSPAPVIGGELFSKLARGEQFTCGLTTMGRLRCWGDNRAGQQGTGGTVSTSAPTTVDGDRGLAWVDVATGADHMCGRRVDGEVSCWGSNTAGELLGAAAGAMEPRPAVVALGGRSIAAMALGWRRTCLIDSDGSLHCGGHAGTGALGIAGEGSRRSPTLLSGSFATVAGGNQLTCATASVAAGGAVQCWGDNEHGAVGDNTFVDRSTPTAVMAPPFLASARLLVASGHVCAVTASLATPPDNGRMYCWGYNLDGQLGSGIPNSSPVPVRVTVTGDPRWGASVAVNDHTCATTNAQELWCWGRNGSGQTGIGMSPTMIPTRPVSGRWSGSSWTQVAAGGTHSCAVRVGADSVECWGANNHSQLGAPSQLPMDEPTPVGITGVTQLALGALHSCALAGMSLRCWGRNDWGQVGNGSGTTVETPQVILGMWSAITAGSDHTCGLQGGALYCWGANEHGQLGSGSFVNEFSPLQVGTDTDWASVSAGYTHTCARKTDGRVACWGSNRRGELGDGSAWRSTLMLVTQ